MPRYVVSRILDALNDRGQILKGLRCLVLGVAYKPDIDDIRESPALDVIGLLQKKGAMVEYHDPYIPTLKTHEGKEITASQTCGGCSRCRLCGYHNKPRTYITRPSWMQRNSSSTVAMPSGKWARTAESGQALITLLVFRT